MTEEGGRWEKGVPEDKRGDWFKKEMVLSTVKPGKGWKVPRNSVAGEEKAGQWMEGTAAKGRRKGSGDGLTGERSKGPQHSWKG